MHIGHARTRVLLEDAIADRVHQMSLAEPYAAIQEKRVVGTARILGHLEGPRARQLVALAFDEAVEREIRVEACTGDELAARRRHRAGRAVRHGGRGQWRRTPGQGTGADIDRHLDRSLPGGGVASQLPDPLQAILLQPGDDIGIRRQQAQRRAFADRMQRRNVGIELFLRKFITKLAETLVPDGRHFASCARGFREKGRSLYCRAGVIHRLGPRASDSLAG
jgi:hypothetical protein